MGLIALIGLIASRGHAGTLMVVPGASGFGMDTRAAYGLAPGTQPTIIRVTNLNDSGAGSLRAALEASGPRVVIFETSGNISIASGGIHITNPYITVAGQTAPSPGITIRDSGLFVETHDVLLQHVRIRPGDTNAAKHCDDALDTSNSASANIVFDHLSVSWAPHINVGFYNSGGPPMNATMWRSIISEGMDPVWANCVPGGVAYLGMIIYKDTTNIAVLQNLFAHNAARNPFLSSRTSAYIANNVMYDFQSFGVNVDTAIDGGAVTSVTSIAGNYFKLGPNDADLMMPAVESGHQEAGAQMYRHDNALANRVDPNVPNCCRLFDFQSISGIDPTVTSPPITVPGYSPLPSSAVLASVTTTAGARPLDRDNVDTRIVNETINGWASGRTGPGSGYIETQAGVGGWPTLAVNRRALTTPASPNTVTASGYTNLEVWLHGYAAALETGATTPGMPNGFLVVGN